ncbi:STAS domain-containing protein [Streptomyces pathocidini]|uniref:STAS domain-containing protein n=1 Tax=Streptomyces pathocidini TaxID=1650571 RepID=UPI003402D5B8
MLYDTEEGREHPEPDVRAVQEVFETGADETGAEPVPEAAPRARDEIREREVGGRTVVELRGEVDMLNSPRIKDRIDRLTDRPGTELVLDLRELRFIDCSGISMLCRARNRTAERDGRLAVVVGDPCVPRMLRLTRLTGAFDLHDNLDTALAA